MSHSSPARPCWRVGGAPGSTRCLRRSEARTGVSLPTHSPARKCGSRRSSDPQWLECSSPVSPRVATRFRCRDLCLPRRASLADAHRYSHDGAAGRCPRRRVRLAPVAPKRPPRPDRPNLVVLLPLRARRGRPSGLRRSRSACARRTARRLLHELRDRRPRLHPPRGDAPQPRHPRNHPSNRRRLGGVPGALRLRAACRHYRLLRPRGPYLRPLHSAHLRTLSVDHHIRKLDKGSGRPQRGARHRRPG